MYDAAVLDYAPTDCDLIGYYIDGRYTATRAQLARFAGKVLVPIAVYPSTNAGIVFDGPPDNSTWPRVVDWVVMRRRAGADPSVYTDADQWASGVNAFASRGVRPPHWWIAQWNGVDGVMSGAVAHQYASISNRYDVSAVLDYWPGVDAITGAPGAPGAPGGTSTPPPDLLGDDMILLNVQPSGTDQPGLWVLSGSLYAHVPTVLDEKALLGAGVKQVTITYAQHQGLVAASAALSGHLAGTLSISGQLSAS